LPQALTAPLIEPAVGAIARDVAVVELKLWHGLNVPLVLSMTALVGGIVLYLARERVWSIAEPMRFGKKWGPNALYGHAMVGLLAGAGVLTRTLQSGYLRRYVLIIVATAVVLVGVASVPLDLRLSPRDAIGIRFHEAISCALILLAALVVVRSTSRFRAITALGVIGYNVAWLFNLFGAPDLAMTQLVIESMLVLLFVFSLYRLPSFTERSSRLNHFRDAAFALAAGGVVAAVLLLVTHSKRLPPISEYYAQQSLPLGHGRNVVNVILVDFRALDTFGEITVLAMAAIGVLTLTKLVISRRNSR
jgi:multicomponent Na+:H+ antiporter subunit A